MESRVGRDPSTQHVTLVTRAEALAAMRKKFPELVKALPSNPFPATLVVRLKSGVDGAKFVLRYRAMGLAGVDDVGLARPNGSMCFISGSGASERARRALTRRLEAAGPAESS